MSKFIEFVIKNKEWLFKWFQKEKKESSNKKNLINSKVINNNSGYIINGDNNNVNITKEKEKKY